MKVSLQTNNYQKYVMNMNELKINKFFNLPEYNTIQNEIESLYTQLMNDISAKYKEKRREVEAKKVIKSGVASIGEKINVYKEFASITQVYIEIIKEIADVEKKITKEIVQRLDAILPTIADEEKKALIEIGIQELDDYYKLLDVNRKDFLFPDWANA